MVGPNMLRAHQAHTEIRERCPLCKRLGAAPVDPTENERLTEHIGRLIAVNAPQTPNVEDW